MMLLNIILQLVIFAGCACCAGDVVWQAVLTLVLMNPRKNKGGKKVRMFFGGCVLCLRSTTCAHACPNSFA